MNITMDVFLIGYLMDKLLLRIKMDNLELPL